MWRGGEAGWGWDGGGDGLGGQARPPPPCHACLPFFPYPPPRLPPTIPSLPTLPLPTTLLPLPPSLPTPLFCPSLLFPVDDIACARRSHGVAQTALAQRSVACAHAGTSTHGDSQHACPLYYQALTNNATVRCCCAPWTPYTL